MNSLKTIIQKAPILFLQAVISLGGLGTLILLLMEPHREGANAGKAFFAVYLDPFIALVYIGSLPFFMGLYQALKLLQMTKENKLFSKRAIKAVRMIKYYVLTTIGFVFLEEIWIILNHGHDDATGGIMMGAMITFGALVVTAAATVFENILQKASDSTV